MRKSHAVWSMGSSLSHLTLLWRLPAVLACVLAFSTLAAAQIFEGTFHDPRKKESVGFSVDLENSADEVLAIVKNVANDRTIHGSRISTKDQGMQIDGAESATSSKVFGALPPPSQVFYKLRSDAIAPVHFPGSNGSGTVIVRYVVHPVAPQRTRLLIDAVFFEESLHTRYFSDGSVEAAEYGEILVQLKALDTAKTPGGAHSAPLHGVEADSTGLQNTLADLQAQLADKKAAAEESEKHLQKLRFNTQGQIRTEGVPLKMFPYNHSSTILTLEKGEDVTVLVTSKYWYRIRTPKGEEGWIYYEFLGPLS